MHKIQKIVTCQNMIEDAELDIAYKRNQVLKEYPNAVFSEVEKYGNGEHGFKFIQEYYIP